MAGKHAVGDIRNLALVGHGAAGKTSLADALLFKAGAVTLRDEDMVVKGRRS